MFIRKNYLFVWIFLLCIIGAEDLCLTASAGESEGKKGKAEIKWLYPPKYYNGNAFSEGRAWVQEEKYGPWSLLDDQGNVLKTGLESLDVTEYHGGIAFFWHPYNVDYRYPGVSAGCLNRSGDVLLRPGAYFYVFGPYSEGLMMASGALDATRFFSLRSEDLMCKYDKNLYGFIDLSGKWVIPPAYDGDYRNDYLYYEFFRFQEGFAVVKKGGKYGFITKFGTPVTDFKFDEAYFFSHKMAPVRLGAKWGVIDTRGRWIAEPVYEKIYGHCEKTYGRSGWITYSSNPIALQKGGKVGFINSKGDVVIDFQYLPAGEKEFPFLYCFNRGRAIIIADDSGERNEYGIIDESGKVLFRSKNCELSLMGDYVLCENEDGQHSVIDRENREYDLPDDFYFLNRWVDPDEKSPYPFMGRKDGKIGYFTISIKND